MITPSLSEPLVSFRRRVRPSRMAQEVVRKFGLKSRSGIMKEPDVQKKRGYFSIKMAYSSAAKDYIMLLT